MGKWTSIPFLTQESLSQGAFFFAIKLKKMHIIGIDVGIRNLGICCLSVEANNTSIKHWHVLDVLGESKNATKTSIEECVRCTLIALRNLEWWNDVGDDDVVAIESQPVGRMATGNIKCKCISHAIQSFVHLMTKAKPIFVNPKTKVGTQVIGEYAGINDLEGGDTNVKKRYKIHKKAAVEAVKNMVETSTWREWYTSLKKKDDAADSYLLAWVANKTKIKTKKRKRNS